MSSVCPSGGALSMCWMPISVLPPGFASTIDGNARLLLAQAFADEAGENVVGTAGRVGHDQRNRFCRKILRDGAGPAPPSNRAPRPQPQSIDENAYNLPEDLFGSGPLAGSIAMLSHRGAFLKGPKCQSCFVCWNAWLRAGPAIIRDKRPILKGERPWPRAPATSWSISTTPR